MTYVSPPGSDQVGHHEHHSAGHDIAAGFAVGALLGWMVKDERHPFLVLACLPLGLLAGVAAAILSPLPPGWWNFALLVVTFVGVQALPHRYARWEDARRLKKTQAQALATEVEYRRHYHSLMAGIASEAELRRLDGLWDASERTDDDHAFLTGLVRRWKSTNPPTSYFQAQAQARGLLCACDPDHGHSCQRGFVYRRSVRAAS